MPPSGRFELVPSRFWWMEPISGRHTETHKALEEIRADLDVLAGQGVSEVFVDLNFDPRIGSPDVDPAESIARAEQVLDALAPQAE